MAGEIDQARDECLGNGIGAEAAHVATPEHKIAEGSDELWAEPWRSGCALVHHAALSMTWRKVPVTMPRRAPHSATAAPLASAAANSGSSAWAVTVAKWNSCPMISVPGGPRADAVSRRARR